MSQSAMLVRDRRVGRLRGARCGSELAHGESRLDLRMSSDQKKAIVRVAAASGMSVSQWALDRLMMSARSDLLDASTVRMSAKAFDEFLSVLEEPRAQEFEDFLGEETIWES